MIKCFEDLLDVLVLIWMDDLLLFAKNEDTFLKVLKAVLEIVKNSG